MKDTSLIIFLMAICILMSIGLKMEHENQTELMQKIHKQNEQIVQAIGD